MFHSGIEMIFAHVIKALKLFKHALYRFVETEAILCKHRKSPQQNSEKGNKITFKVSSIQGDIKYISNSFCYFQSVIGHNNRNIYLGLYFFRVVFFGKWQQKETEYRKEEKVEWVRAWALLGIKWAGRETCGVCILFSNWWWMKSK